MDATAGLVGNAVLAAHRFGVGLGPESNSGLAAETNRFDPPVQLTSRVTTATLDIDGAIIPEGARVVVLLAAANRDPAFIERPDEFDPTRQPASLTFGAGPRTCPGAGYALALAAGVLDALGDRSAIAVERAIAYERRSNLRVPARLRLQLNRAG